MSRRQVAGLLFCSGILFCFQARALCPNKGDFSAACPDGVCPGLGHTFYLPDPDAISSGGRVFLLNAKLGVCAGTMAQERSTRAVNSADSMRELVMDTNAELGITGSYTTAVLNAKGNIDVKTSTSSDITTSFHATHLDVTSIKQEVYLEQSTECLGNGSNIDPHFLERFKALPEIDALAVAESSSWAPYVNFLKDQGSHIMVRQSIGSRFQKWESSTSSDSKTAETLKVKACASVEGVTDSGGWSVQSCAAYNESEKRTALKTESHQHMVILGGTTATRTAILSELNEQTLDDFIRSAPSGLAVSYGFKPIWETLITVFMVRCNQNGASSEDCRHQQRAYNLQAAYEGWQAIGCPKLTTTNGFVYQGMSVTDPRSKIKTYQCNAGRTGCRTDDDCRIGGAFASQCYCYGRSCIEKGEEVRGTSTYRSKVQGSKSGGTRFGANNACVYRVGVRCRCDKSWAGGQRERQLYIQNGFTLSGSSSALSNLTVV